MTTMERTTTRPPRPRRLQDELLADLRQTAPLPIARPEVNRPAPAPAERPEPIARRTPTIDVRVTPLRWSVPRLRARGAGPGLVLTAGPIRISITGFGR
jgi:hypothetical protein